MYRRSWLTGLVLAMAAMAHAAEPGVDLTTIDRTIRKEPAYEAEPYYALLVAGQRAEHRVWLVIDGDEVSYLDRNGNGDLTDEGERIDLDREATDKLNVTSSGGVVAMHVFTLGEVAGSELNFQLWIRDPTYDISKDESLRDHPEFRKAHQDMRDLHLRNGSLLRTAVGGVQAQIPLALTLRPEDAQVCHLLGPLTFALKWGDRQRLEPWPKQTVLDVYIGSRNLPPRGWTHDGFDFARLTTSEVPENLHPVATIEYAAGPDGKPARQELTLNQRCCGDTFYATFGLPKGATAGDAKISLRFPLWLGHSVEPIQFDVPINQEPSKTGEVAYVMFHDPRIELKHAVNALRKEKLDVTIRPDVLVVRSDGDRQVAIRLNHDPEVQDVARGLAEGTDFANDLGRCDSRFEIGPYEADNGDALRRVVTLLQELTAGFVYQSWDQQLSGPR